MKIAIIGNAGSGKSTLGKKLEKKLKIRLYHLDQYFWKPHWQESDYTIFEKKHNQLCDLNEWIIEGVAVSIFAYRVQKADIIIFLDFSPFKCLFRVLKRSIMNYGRVRSSSAPECPDRLPPYSFLKFILTFNTVRKPTIETLLDTYGKEKIIYRVRSHDELDNAVQRLLEK